MHRRPDAMTTPSYHPVDMVLRLLLIGLVAGCAGLEPGVLPTDEELCAARGGMFRAGICHTAGGQ
jgi:hypothetical protein